MRNSIKNIKSKVPQYLAIAGSNALALAYLAERYQNDTLGLGMSVILIVVSVALSIKKEK